MSDARPMGYTTRLHQYLWGPGRWRGHGLTGRQARQLDRMARRETYRSRRELLWTPPPPRKDDHQW